jgi:hypothetical protein
LSPGRVKNFFFSTSSRPVLVPTQPPIQWVLGTLSPGVKRQGRVAHHSPPTSAEVNLNSTPIRLHGIVLNFLSTGTTLQDVPGGKVNILGGHSVGHSKKKVI